MRCIRLWSSSAYMLFFKSLCRGVPRSQLCTLSTRSPICIWLYLHVCACACTVNVSWRWDPKRQKWAVTGKKLALRRSAAYPDGLGVSLVPSCVHTLGACLYLLLLRGNITVTSWDASEATTYMLVVLDFLCLAISCGLNAMTPGLMGVLTMCSAFSCVSADACMREFTAFHMLSACTGHACVKRCVWWLPTMRF